MTASSFFSKFLTMVEITVNRLSIFSITKKIAAAALIILSFLVASLHYYSYKFLYPKILETEYQKVETILNYISHDIEAALDFGSQESVKHILQGVMDSSNVIGVYFKDGSFTLGEKHEFKINTTALFKESKKRPYFAAHTVIYDSDFVLYYDATKYLSTLKDYEKFLFYLTLSIIVIMLLLLVYFKFMLLPFTKISKEMQSIDLNTPKIDKSLLEIKTKDEREDIVTAFFGMAKRIQERTNELDELNKTLETSVQNRTQRLQDAMHALGRQKRDVQKTLDELKLAQNQLIETEKMASLGTLVAGVAHEINTPVGISYTGITHLISSSKKLLKSYEKGEMTKDDFQDYFDDAQEFHSVIQSNLVRAANLVKSFKQVAVDQSSEHIREFNIREYIDEILLSLKNRFKHRSIGVEVDCEDLTIKSYAGIWSQIFTNLILNSLSHAYDIKDVGTIKIGVKSTEKTIFIEYSDDGRGISAENLKHIFEPFFTTSRSRGGSGLGLHIIYNLITTTLEGTISCESTVNNGVTFKINIPRYLKEK